MMTIAMITIIVIMWVKRTSARRQDGLAGGKKVKYRQFIGGILVKCTLYYSWFNRMKHK